MKQIAVIANDKEYANYLAWNLNIYFKNYAEITCYNTSGIEKLEYINEKYIVISAFTIFQKVKPKIKDDSELIICKLALNRMMIGNLHKIPKGTKALMVNIDYRSCMEVITMIYAAGFKEFELIPYYPGMDYNSRITLAVTPNETMLVPKEIKTVIDIGQRIIDVSSILELSEKLEIENPFDTEEGKKALENILIENVGMEIALGENKSMLQRINVLLKLLKQGVLITDMLGRIHLANDVAMRILSKRADHVVGFSINEILPELEMSANGEIKDSNGDLINVDGTNYIFTVSKVASTGNAKGNIIMIESFFETEKRQHKMRSQIAGQGHKAEYYFDNILGNSPMLQETKKIALRMSKSDSSIILFGESGVGKELFAQSIHNNSSRRDYHFVAVNCSALPENLLESELFGYEEGAFSGAKKGGKIGLFELAHNGTLFLDEIGEMPLHFQAKLLRVIEEKKILRVGGSNIISVNVRIIAATNRNLKEMVKNKEFRRDLYYRLSVLPIYIPTLKERGADILILFEQFCRNFGCEIELSDDAKEKILKHQWEGNVRELKNVVEYLVNLNKEVIESQDLPFNEWAQHELYYESDICSDGCSDAVKNFVRREKGKEGLFSFILSEMYISYKDSEYIGRNKLTVRSIDYGYDFTEQEIRGALSKLKRSEFVISQKGRTGSMITESGIELMKFLKKSIDDKRVLE